MISIILLLSITVVAGYLIYRSYSLQLRQQQRGVALATKLAKSLIAEKITLISGFINTSNKKAVLIFYNFGDQATNITKIVIPGIAPGGRIVVFVFNTNVEIPPKDVKTIILDLSGKDVSYPPGIAVKINVWTITGRVYTFNIKTIG